MDVIEPGLYRVTVSESVQPQKAPGYAVDFEVFTSP
jgi:hypothetical protein